MGNFFNCILASVNKTGKLKCLPVLYEHPNIRIQIMTPVYKYDPLITVKSDMILPFIKGTFPARCSLPAEYGG